MFRVFTTKEFDEDFDRLDNKDKIKVDKILNQLRDKGSSIGKPLKVPYFREKKFGEKRLYYLSYKNSIIVLVLAISNKKAQQDTINSILSEIDNYKKIITEKIE